MASVTARKNPSGTISYRVQFRIDGRMCQESFTDPKGAESFGDLVDRVGGETARRVLKERNERKDAITLSAWTHTYLDPVSGHLSGITPATRSGYQQIADRSFLVMLGELPLASITRQDVARWVVWQEAQPSKSRSGLSVSAKTMNNYHGVLSAVLAAAVEAGHIDGNPARGTRLTKGVRDVIPFLTHDEFSTILEFVPAHYKPLVLFLAGTGMRWGEATALTWADLDLTAVTPTARVNKAWKKGPHGVPFLGPPKTRKSNRTVSLWPELVASLPPRGPGDQLVFRTPKEHRRIWSERFYRAAWGPAVTAANDDAKCAALGLLPIGKKPRVHDLRHAHASWLIAAGAPLPYVQNRLGHENITTTVDTYGHLLPEAHLQMANMMADAMAGVLPSFKAIEG